MTTYIEYLVIVFLLNTFINSVYSIHDMMKNNPEEFCKQYWIITVLTGAMLVGFYAVILFVLVLFLYDDTGLLKNLNIKVKPEKLAILSSLIGFIDQSTLHNWLIKIINKYLNKK